MKQSIFTGFSPNLEWDDAFLAWRLIFQPWRWRKGEAVKALENQFAHDFKMPHAVAFESGRTSLASLLQTSALSLGDEVLLQAYTCVAVPNAVLWAGFKPVYIDCEKETLTMSPGDLEKKITPRTKAVIIQYTFGQIGKLEELIAIAREYKLIIIEDSAHVIHGGHNNQLLGTWGDASFISFGRDKALSGVFGGLALLRDDGWAKRLREKQKGYPLPDRGWVLKQLLHPVITLKVKLLYDVGGFGKLLFCIVRKLSLISKSVEPEERYGQKPEFIFHRMPNALALLILRQYEKIGRFNIHRKKVAAFYAEALKQYENCGLPPPDDSVNYLRFPLRVENPKELIRLARLEKIYLGDWYQDAIAPQGVNYEAIQYQRESCPVAEEVAKASVNLPTDIHISFGSAGRVIHVVESYLESIQ